MKSFIKKVLVALVILVVINHYTGINITNRIAVEIDKISNSSYATAFVENVQEKADYLIDSISIRKIERKGDRVSFEVTFDLPRK